MTVGWIGVVSVLLLAMFWIGLWIGRNQWERAIVIQEDRVHDLEQQLAVARGQNTVKFLDGVEAGMSAKGAKS